MINITAELQESHFKNFIRSAGITENATKYRKPQSKRDELKTAEDDLTSIRREVKNLCEVNDIQDELHITERVHYEQTGVIDQLVASSITPQTTWQSSRLQLQHKRLQEEISHSHAEVKKMLENAGRTHAAVLQLLNLKQQHATVTESRFARKQAEETARQNDTVQLFTFVTIIFAPASFMAAFFAIPDLALPGIDTSRLNGAVGTIVVFSIVIWLPIIAYIFFVDYIRNFFEQREARRRGLSSGHSTGAVPELSAHGGGSGSSSKNHTVPPSGQAKAGVRARLSWREKATDIEQGTAGGKTVIDSWFASRQPRSCGVNS